MRFSNKVNNTTSLTNSVNKVDDKGCKKKKYRNCYKSSSSSSCSSSSSSSSSSSCSSASYENLEACHGKIKNLTGTNITYTNATFTSLSFANRASPLVLTSNYLANIETNFNNFTSTLLLNANNLNIIFPTIMNSNMNGAILTIANITNSAIDYTLTVTAPDVINITNNSNYIATGVAAIHTINMFYHIITFRLLSTKFNNLFF